MARARLSCQERIRRHIAAITELLEEMEKKRSAVVSGTNSEKPIRARTPKDPAAPKRGRGRPKLQRYLGYRNVETYAVAKWIINDSYWNQVARNSRSYNDFCRRMYEEDIFQTPCGVHLVDSKVDAREVARIIKKA